MPPSPTGHASSIPAGIAKPSARSKRPNAGCRAARRAATAGARRSRCWPRRIRQVRPPTRRTSTTRRRSQLVQTNDTIYHEDLQTANMVKNHHLAKSISDAGWSAFLSILAAKAACAGRRVVAVPPAYTSQTCSGCGVLVAKGLSVRWHCLPGLRNEPASGPQRRQEHRDGSGRAFGEAWRWPRRRTENPPALAVGSVKLALHPRSPRRAGALERGARQLFELPKPSAAARSLRGTTKSEPSARTTVSSVLFTSAFRRAHSPRARASARTCSRCPNSFSHIAIVEPSCHCPR